MKRITKKNELIFYSILIILFYLVNYCFKLFVLQTIINILILVLIYKKKEFIGGIKRTILFLGILFSFFQNVGYLLINDENFEIFNSFKVFFGFTLSFVICAMLFSIIIKNTFNFLDNKLLIDSNLPTKIIDKNSFVFYWLIILGSWIPYIIIGYPGILSNDSIAQVAQIMGDIHYRDHNPFFHTLLVKPFIDFGIYVFDDINLGVAMYLFFQMILMSAIFSYSLSYLKSINCRSLFIKISLLYFALYPIHALYSITMWSDVIFSGCILLYVISLAKLISMRKVFFSSTKQRLFFLATILVMVLIRHTGIYILALTTLILGLYKLKKFKIIIYSSLAIVILFGIIKNPIYNKLGIVKGPVSAVLSIPIQQIARTVKFHKNELVDSDYIIINAFFKKNFEGKYDSRFFRKTIDNFNVDYYANNKFEFGKLWFKLFLRFPEAYAKSFLYGNYGYWYPDVKYSIFYKYIHKNPYRIQQHYFKLFDRSLSTALIIKIIYKIREIPIISLFFSIGFYFWVLCVLFGYCIYSGRTKLTLLFIPIIVLWLTAMASPVYAEFRYVYGLFTCLPLLLGLSLCFKESNNSFKC